MISLEECSGQSLQILCEPKAQKRGKVCHKTVVMTEQLPKFIFPPLLHTKSRRTMPPRKPMGLFSK